MSDSLFTLVFIGGIVIVLKVAAETWLTHRQREQRRGYYREKYLKSDDWKRKRWVVLKRDGPSLRLLWCESESSSPQALCAAEYRERTD